MVALDSCLSESRGQILERNSCRGPWQGALDLRVTQGINTPQGRVEVLFDVFNVLNLLSGENPEIIVDSYDFTEQDFISSLPLLPAPGLQAEWRF